MANLLASTSSSSTHKMKRYDVFLSFRGIDTRNNFTGHLRRALQHKGIKTFIDNELRRGEEISPSLITAIRESKISIIIFSKNYASSPWCLDELVEILKCRESLGQLVWPVFFNVDPSEVRNHRDSFGEALANFEETSSKNKEKLPNWKVSLTKASNLSGWRLANQDESQLIQRIVEAALTKLDRTLLHVAKYPVGIDDRLRELEPLLYAGFGKNDDVRLIGICGIGGMGKTTIAKAVFNKFADDFEGSSFLENVRETSQQHLGMVQLQEMLLYHMLGDKNIKVGNTHRGINIIRERLCHKRVLVILDDVDELEQLETLAGGHEWFGPGSRIIITTRNKHILTAHGANEIYEVQGLDHQRALEFLSWNAFKRNKPLEDYNSLVDCIIKYANGLPLALEVLGSFLFGRKKHQWESAIHNLEKKPDKKLYEILKISFDALSDDKKALFLDIACFFVGADINDATEVLGSSNFCPIIGIEVLLDLSLINIEENKLKMHHVIQEVGKEIVRQESPEAGKRSRLWSPEDVFHVFSENTGTDSIEGILLKLHELRTLHLNANSFKKMKRLRLLIFANVVLSTNIGYISNELRLIDLPGYQFPTLPFNSGPKQLVILNMPHSRIQLLDQGFKNFERLKVLNFSCCRFLTKIPDLSTAPNLESLYFAHCTSLVEIHESVGFLTKLLTLDLGYCSNLKSFPRNLVSKYVSKLVFRGCLRLQHFPNILEKMEFLGSLDLCGTAIKELPSSIELIVGLNKLDLYSCEGFMHIPTSIYKLPCLEVLDLGHCTKLTKFPKYATLSVPVELLHNPKSVALRHLNLQNCNLLEVDFLATPFFFPMLERLVLSNNKFVSLPFFHSPRLHWLDLSNNRFLVKLPSFRMFSNLSYLLLSNCPLLQEIPALPDCKMYLEAIDCKSLVETPCKIMAKIISNDQGFLRDSEMEATILGLEIPDWFSHKLGESVTFNTLSSNIFDRLKHIGLRLHHNLGESITFNVVPNMLMNMAAAIIYVIFQSSCTNLELSFDLLAERDSLILSLTRQKLSTTSGNAWLIFLPARDLVSECFPFFAFNDCDQSVGLMLQYVRKIRVKFNTEWSTHSPKLVSTCAVHILRDQDQLMLDNKLIKLSHLSILRHLMKRKIDDDCAEGDLQSSRSWPQRKRQCGPSGIK